MWIFGYHSVDLLVAQSIHAMTTPKQLGPRKVEYFTCEGCVHLNDTGLYECSATWFAVGGRMLRGRIGSKLTPPHWCPYLKEKGEG